VSQDQYVTYEELLTSINGTTKISEEYRAANYFDFAVNVLTAIVHNQDVVLIDYRNSFVKASTSFIDVSKVDLSMPSMLERIKKSTSKIGIYSSGTEGNPKLIYQPVSRLLQSVRIEGLYENSVWGFTYNPAHSAGIQMLLQVVCNQAAIVDLYKCSRTQVLAQLEDHQVQFLSATPTFYRTLAPYDFKFEAVKSITLNGEKSSQELIDKVKSCFPNARVRNIYGSTEAGPLMSSDSTKFKVPTRLIEKVKIENDELCLHKSLVSRSVESSEWYATGDLVEIVEKDPLTINFVSRRSRIINVGGQNVNPQEVEERLLTHGAVKDSRVYGRKSSLMGHLVVAEVQVMSDVSEKDLLDYCRQHLTNYKVPRIIKFVELIKVGRTGKKELN